MFVITKDAKGLTIFDVSDASEEVINSIRENSPEGTTMSEVASAADLLDSSILTMADFTAMYGAAGKGNIKKFPSKKKAAERVFPILGWLSVAPSMFEAPEAAEIDAPVISEVTILEPVAPETAPVETETEPKPKAARKSKGVNLAAAETAYACRAGTKQAAIIDALAHPSGTTLDGLRAATGGKWGDSAIKSALYWDVNSVKGYGVRTMMTEDGSVPHTYFLVLPAGMEAPLPHTPAKTVKGE